MNNLRTPGVYIEEVSTFPPTVNRVATAIPVFIGYTELDENGDLHDVPTKINSLLEYETHFGGEPTTSGRDLKVFLDQNNGYALDHVEVGYDYYLYHALRHFYSNGGGSAYILSVDTYGSAVDKDELIGGLADLEKADEPTLILVPDAWALTAVEMGEIQNSILAHCQKMKDRFGIFDVKHGNAATISTDADAFRNALGNQHLKYGAAYYPELHSTLASNGPLTLADLDTTVMKDLADVGVSLVDLGNGAGDTSLIAYNEAVVDNALIDVAPSTEDYTTDFTAVAETPAADSVASFEAELLAKIQEIKKVIDRLYSLGNIALANPTVIAKVNEVIGVGGVLNGHAQTLVNYDFGYSLVPTNPSAPGEVDKDSYDNSQYPGAPDYDLGNPTVLPAEFGGGTTEKDAVTNLRPHLQTLSDAVIAVLNEVIATVASASSDDDLFTTSQALTGIKSAIRSKGIVLPPSGAIAGVYASVDRTRGVWKAPANVSLNAVSAVARKMLTSDSDDLNKPGDGSGKSINAIRLFQGKGTLVYGARTLAGNDNEWRYVPVRRLFIMVEESILKATESLVFEPNDANTWQKVRAMIENFLTDLWRDGALAGAVPEDAFFVKVGLPETMTAQDILNGYMNIEIGMAAVRPAEFVILKFSHKLQES